MARPLRLAVCNEVFQGVSFEQACSQIRRIGYSGIEIAPFTLSEDAVTLTAEDRARIRETIARHDLAFVGLHWLLVSPKGLHATTPDKVLREQTWTFIKGLIDLCADLGASTADEDRVMVLGSPNQRSATDGATPGQATEILKEELTQAGQHAEKRGVQLLLEPLSRNQTDVVTSLAEAVAIVKEIGSPAVATMFDVHNAVDEVSPHVELLKQYAPYIRHVHVNEMDGREPGSGTYDFPALLSALRDLEYERWVSLEVFDFERDAYEIASRALNHLAGALPS